MTPGGYKCSAYMIIQFVSSTCARGMQTECFTGLLLLDMHMHTHTHTFTNHTHARTIIIMYIRFFFFRTHDIGAESAMSNVCGAWAAWEFISLRHSLSPSLSPSPSLCLCPSPQCLILVFYPFRPRHRDKHCRRHQRDHTGILYARPRV